MVDPVQPFIWGANGQMVTDQERTVAQALGSPDMSPVGHWMQGVGRMAQAGVDSYNANPLNQFPDQPGGNTMMGNIIGLGSRVFGMGGGLY